MRYGSVLVFDGGVLRIAPHEGDAVLSMRDDKLSIQEGYRQLKIPRSELVELRNFLARNLES